ncbi:MAG: 4-hydroxythreonine-4-phosphate dehydrogenase PdxA [Planctomycetaceae bacterium]
MSGARSVPDSTSSVETRPFMALTLGDIAGIGPEVAVAAALDTQVRTAVRPVLVGSPAIVERVLVQRRSTIPGRLVRAPFEANYAPLELNVLPVGSPQLADVPPGGIDERAGQGAYEALVAGIDLALSGDVAAIVTAPLHKESLRLAGITHPGHTEILAERCRARSHAMMLHLPTGGPIQLPGGLSVAHVTLHTSIASVPTLLTTDRIRDTIHLLHGFLAQLGTAQPRIGVCALNPHAGEHGLFGDEEGRLIEPAVRAAASQGLDVRGPLPADTLVRAAIVDSRYDGLVAMYHEQGHIPFKLIGFDRAVNVTLGLPIIRTSPSHGTAFDIAWQGRARSDGMIGAILTAARLVANRGVANQTRQLRKV